MIAKVRLGRSFGGLVRYLFEGHHDDPTANKQAEVLASNGVRLGSMEQMIADFNRHRLLNPDLGVVVWHAALSFHTNDRPQLTNSKLIKLAEEYMKELGLDPDNTQWLLVKHNDTDHPHAHLVMSRIDFDGLRINRSFSKVRSQRAANLIARRHELTVAEDRKRPHMRYGKELTPQQQETIATIQTAVERELPNCETLTHLADLLAPHQINLQFQRSKQKGKEGAITGLTFERNGQFVRGSGLGKGYSAGPLAERLKKQETQLPSKKLENIDLKRTDRLFEIPHEKSKKLENIDLKPKKRTKRKSQRGIGGSRKRPRDNDSDDSK